MNVVWTDRAIKHLTAIYEYISRDSEQYACRTVDRITARSKQLAAFPTSGQVVVELGDPLIREIIEGPYRVIYRIEESTLSVMAVIHSARLLPTKIQGDE